MKYSLLLLFHALLAGVTSLLTLFLIQTVVRKVFIPGQIEVSNLIPSENTDAEGEVKTYSPHAFVLNLIQGVIPTLFFLFPLSAVVLNGASAEFTSLVLFSAVLFLGVGILIAEKAGRFRAHNPYPIVKPDVKDD